MASSCLLFDENLSPRLPTALKPLFEASQHVRDVGLKGKTDQEIWRFAADQGFAIVTKDDDFRGMSLLYGAPPKVIWLIIGNTSTAEIVALLTASAKAVQAFLADPSTALLTIRKG